MTPRPELEKRLRALDLLLLNEKRLTVITQLEKIRQGIVDAIRRSYAA